jgi:zinc transporter ZupT
MVMSPILLGVLAAIGFSGASQLALFGRELRPQSQAYWVAIAAAILLALAFADLFPEGLELAREPAIVGFVGGFTLLFLTEAFTSAHTHHSPEEHVHKHALGPFVLGLGIHNLADGFVLGVGAKESALTSGLVGLGILIHQMPVGISLAAVLLAAHATRAQIVRTGVLLGLAIPLAAALTISLPVPSNEALGILNGLAAGVVTYIGAAHLLPEAQTERSSRVTGIVFAATLIVITIALFTVLGHEH